MLTLPIRTVGELLVLEDDGAQAQRYVALRRPCIARDADGHPRLRLVRWVMADGAVAGARLTLDLELQPRPDELALADIALSRAAPVPWLNPSLRLEGPLISAKEVQVASTSAGSATVSLDLSAAEASVLAPLLAGQNVSPLQVTWLAAVLVRAPPLQVVAFADASEVRRRTELVTPDRRVSVTRAIIDASARIEIQGSEHAELEAALRSWVLDELEAKFASGRALEIRTSASEVLTWPVQLATTLDLEVPPGRSLVETIVLDSSELGRAPPLELRVLGDFTGRLERVDVRLASASGGELRELAVHDDAARSIALGTSDFRHSWRVKLRERPPGAWTEWHAVHGWRSLLLPIATPVALRCEVLATTLDFRRRWQSLSVTLTHVAPDGATSTDVLELGAAQPSAGWSAALDGARGRVSAQLVYRGRQGQLVERNVDDIQGEQLVIGDPMDGNILRLTLVPTGAGWSDVAQAMVDVAYVDDAYVVEETIELRSLEDLVTWELPVRAEGPRIIRWRLHASFRDGRFAASDWQESQPGIVPLRLERGSTRTVQVLPVFFAVDVTRRAQLSFHAGSRVQTLVVTDRSSQTVALDSAFTTWSVQWSLADGRELPESTRMSIDDVIVLPVFEPT